MSFIKYTIHGFQQNKLVENGLDNNDALVMSVIKEMITASGTEKIIHEGHQYTWVKQSMINEYLPIIGSLRTIQRVFKKLTDKGIFKSHIINSKNGKTGKYYYVRSTKLLDELSDFVTCQNGVRSSDNLADDQPPKCHNKDSPIIDSPIIDSKPIVRFDEFWNEYPKARRINKKKCLSYWKNNKLDAQADLIINNLKNQVAKQYRYTEDRFIPHAYTYLNGERWNDAVTEITPPEPPKRKIKDISGMDYKKTGGFNTDLTTL